MAKVNLLDLKRLRNETSAGIVYCKKALMDADGDYDKARELLKEMGHALAAKKASRNASDGVVAAKTSKNFAAMLELNCETDFVARNEKFQNFAEEILNVAHINEVNCKQALLDCKVANYTSVAEMIVDMVSIFKENVVLSKYTYVAVNQDEVVGCYVHNKYTDNLGKLGVLVKLQSKGDALPLQKVAKSLCIQVMSGAPEGICVEDLNPSVVKAQKDKYQDDIRGKPENIAEKIIAGKLKKFYKECVLLEQDFYADNEKSVKRYLAEQEKKIETEIKIISYKTFKLGDANA